MEMKNQETQFTPKEEQSETLRHKVGDVIERAGEKLSEAGAEKLGRAVYRAGNKIEHSGEEINK